MASTNSTETTESATNCLDALDDLSRKSSQLYALLVTIYGGGFEAFNGCNDTIKDNYLWACADLAKEIEGLVTKVSCAKVMRAQS